MRSLTLIALLLLVLPVVPSLFAEQPEDLSSDERYLEIRRKLENTKVTLDFDQTPLQDVLNFIHNVADINLVTDPAIYDENEEIDVTFRVSELKLRSALKLIMSFYDLSLIYQDGVLLVTTKDATKLNTFLRVYDIRDLTLKIKDFPGPSIELAGGGGGSDSIGALFTSEEEEGEQLGEEEILELILNNTAGDSWDTNEKPPPFWNDGSRSRARSRPVVFFGSGLG